MQISGTERSLLRYGGVRIVKFTHRGIKAESERKDLLHWTSCWFDGFYTHLRAVQDVPKPLNKGCCTSVQVPDFLAFCPMKWSNVYLWPLITFLPQCGHELWAVQPKSEFYGSDCFIWGPKEVKVSSISKVKHIKIRRKSEKENIVLCNWNNAIPCLSP